MVNSSSGTFSNKPQAERERASRKKASHRQRRVSRRLAIEGLEMRSLLAADIAVIDANVVPLANVTQSVLNGIVEHNGKIYYRDADPNYGAELFQYDPVTDLSRRVTDWNPGISDSIPNIGNLSLVAKSTSHLFFSIATDTMGRELGIYDTVNDTWRVIDALPGTGSSAPSSVHDIPGNAVIYGNKIFFASDSIYYVDFTDPLSSPQTVFSQGNTAFRNLTVVGSKLFFTSQNLSSEQVRWLDLNNPSQFFQTVSLPFSNSYSNLRAVGSRLYFSAFDGTVGQEVRWIDTTLTTPTVNTLDFAAGTSSSDPNQFTVVNDRLYFTSTTSAQGRELRWIQPSVSNAIQTMEILPGSSGASPSSLLAVGTRLYFNAFEPTNGSEIRWIDATLTTPVLNTIDSTPGAGSIFVEQLVASGSHLFGLSNSFGSSPEPYYLDLNSPTAVMTLLETRPGSASANPAHLVAQGSRLYFAGEMTAGREMVWVDVATAPSQFHIVDVRDTAGAQPNSYFATEDKIFFAGTQAYGGRNIGWFPTKTMNPTVNWNPWSAGETPSFFPSFTQIGDKLFFISTDTSYGAEVRWIDVDDPTMTLHTLDINPGGASSTPTSLTRVGDYLFWSSYDPIAGKELRWVDARLNDPTVQTIEITAPPFWGNPTSLTARGDQLYFVGTDSTYGSEMRRLDTSQSTWTVETFDFNTGVGNGFVGASQFVGDRLYFVGVDSTFSERIGWVSTTFGSTGINVMPFGILNSPSWFVAAGSRLYFRASDSTSGSELRWFDTALTTPVVNTIDFSPGPNSTQFEFEFPIVEGNKMFYSARNFLGEQELRWIDITATTTTVNTLDLGVGSNNPRNFFAQGGRVFFQATSGPTGSEMVILQPNSGATAPSYQWVDLTAGTNGSTPANFTSVGNRIYFMGFKLGAKEETYIYSEAVAPTNLLLSNSIIPENIMSGSPVGTLSTTDANTTDSFTYSLVAGTGDTDNSLFQIAGNSLLISSSVDFETKSSYSIRVRTTDIDGLTFDKTFVLQVQDLVEDVFANGTSGNDLIEVTMTGATSDFWLVRVNGTTIFQGLASMVGTVMADGKGGTDTFRMMGTSGIDTMQASGDEFFFNGNRATTTDIENRSLMGQDGNDELIITGGFSGVVDGGLGSDRLHGPDATNLWQVTGSNVGLLNGTTSYLNVESLSGGDENDEFRFAIAGKVTGSLQGGPGTDTVDQGLLTAGITLNAATQTATNIANWGGVDIWRGSTSSANDKFIGRNAATIYVVEGQDETTVNGSELRLLQIENVSGGTAADQFSFLNSSSFLRGTANGGTGVDQMNWSVWPDPVTVNLATKQAPGVFSFLGFESFQGSAQSDLLIGPTTTTTWQITGLDQGLVGTIAFSGFESLQGNSGADTFRMTTALSKMSGTVDGGAGVDTVAGPNQATNWLLQGAETISVQETQFTEIENLTGGTSSDRFEISSPSTLITGTLNGGSGIDTLSWSASSTPVEVNLALGQGTQVSRFMGVERLEGGTGSDRVIGPNTTSTWMIQGPDQGQVGSVQFFGFETSTGGSGNDSFRFVGATASMSNGIEGGNGLDTLTGPDVESLWNVNGAGSGQVNATSFTGFENLTGGLLNDDFDVSASGSLAGNLSGGSGVNALQYASWVTGVSVDLSTNLAGNATAISGVTSKIQIVLGGSGDDTLKGSATLAVVLLGNAGNDVLIGSSGKDLLWGGVGSDQITAGSGEDLLIAGATSWDTSLFDIRAIRAEWTSSRPFATRIANLNGTGTGTRANGDTFLTNLTVLGDLDVDQLFGGLSNDWFWSSLSEAMDRVATDRLDLD